MDILKYKVYHGAFEGTAVHVANVWINEDVPILEALEEVFRKTNNVEGSWSWGPYEGGSQVPNKLDECENLDYFENVEVVRPLRIDKDLGRVGHRSTSVGDFVVVDGDVYNCENFGWTCLGEEVA